jgi:hypothetical protein
MAYNDTHAFALDLVTRFGTSATFTTTSAGTENPLTGLFTSGSSSTVAGRAVRVAGDPKVYEVLGLVEAKAPTLFFVPTTFGDSVALGATVTWSSTVYTVRQADPIAPDGNNIAWRVVVEVRQ